MLFRSETEGEVLPLRSSAGDLDQEVLDLVAGAGAAMDAGLGLLDRHADARREECTTPQGDEQARRFHPYQLRGGREDAQGNRGLRAWRFRTVEIMAGTKLRWRSVPPGPLLAVISPSPGARARTTTGPVAADRKSVV